MSRLIATRASTRPTLKILSGAAASAVLVAGAAWAGVMPPQFGKSLPSAATETPTSAPAKPGHAAGASEATTAQAARSLRFVDETGRVVIYARGIDETGLPPRGSGNRIDLEVTGASMEAVRVAIDNPMVKRVELVGGDTPRLSIILHRDFKATDLATLLSVEHDAAGLRLVLPKVTPANAIAEAAAPVAMTAEAHAATERKLAVATLLPKPETNLAAAAESDDELMAVAAAELAAKEAPAAPAVADDKLKHRGAATTASLAATPTNAAVPRALGLADERPVETTSGDAGIAGVLGVLALLLISGGMIVWNRRRRLAPPAYGDAIHVVATRSLGARVRMVLLAVGDQRMLVSVSDTASQLMGRWRESTDDEAEMSRVASNFGDLMPEIDEELPIAIAAATAAAGFGPPVAAARTAAEIGMRTTPPPISTTPRPTWSELASTRANSDPQPAAAVAAPSMSLPVSATDSTIAMPVSATDSTIAMPSWSSSRMMPAVVDPAAPASAHPAAADRVQMSPAASAASETAQMASRFLETASMPASENAAPSPASRAVEAASFAPRTTATAAYANIMNDKTPVDVPAVARMVAAAFPITEVTADPAIPTAASPAVAGILKLRAGAAAVTATTENHASKNGDVAAAPQEDAAWARELLAATRMNSTSNAAASNRSANNRSSASQAGAPAAAGDLRSNGASL